MADYLKIKVLVIDDSAMVRDLMGEALSKKPGMKAVGIGMDDPEGIEQVFASFHDIVLMNIDTTAFNAIETIQAILALQPATRIVVMTSDIELPYLSKVFESGAVGFIDKKEAFNEVLLGIGEVLKQRLYISPRIRQKFSHPTNMPRQDKSVEGLSRRQREILKLIAQGKPMEEIAFDLNLSLSTVHLDRRKMIVKLGMDSVADLAKYALRKGLIFGCNRHPFCSADEEACRPGRTSR